MPVPLDGKHPERYFLPSSRVLGGLVHRSCSKENFMPQRKNNPRRRPHDLAGKIHRHKMKDSAKQNEHSNVVSERATACNWWKILRRQPETHAASQ